MVGRPKTHPEIRLNHFAFLGSFTDEFYFLMDLGTNSIKVKVN